MSVALWIPRKYGSPLGFVVRGGEVVASDIRHAAAAAQFPGLVVDRYGMNRRGPDGLTLAQRIANGRVAS